MVFSIKKKLKKEYEFKQERAMRYLTHTKTYTKKDLGKAVGGGSVVLCLTAYTQH